MLQEHFECGKCDSPLEIDPTLNNLSMAQVALLTSKNVESYRALRAEGLERLNSEEFIPRDRLATYKEAHTANSKPLIYRNLMESIDDTLDEEEEEEEDEEEQEEQKEDVANKMTSSDTAPEVAASEKGLDSYVVLENGSMSQPHEVSVLEPANYAISLRIKTLTKIFDILSSHQEIDHPLSQDCAELLLDNLKLKFDQTQLEKDSYLAFLRKLEEKDAQEKLHYEGDYRAELDRKLMTTKEEVASMLVLENNKLADLRKLEEERLELESQLKEYTAELDQIRRNELSDLLISGNRMKQSYNEQLSHLNQLKASYNCSLDRLDNIRSTNVYSMIFPISVDPSQRYGTINGLRLGYQVEWSEANAALGQVVLLLSFLTRSLATDLGDYELVPMGSQSQIIKFSSTEEDGQQVRQRSILHVYNTNEFSLGKLFNYNKLDAPMILILHIMAAIQSSLLERDPEAVFPYEISPKYTAIGGKSIRVTSNAEWTVACRFMLTNLKWLLAYTNAYMDAQEPA